MANRPTPHRDPQKNAHLVDYLARERHAFLCAVARREGIEPQAVDDVVQSALFDVLRSFPGPHETHYATAYAARCVRSEAWKHHRRHARKESRNVPPNERERSDLLGTPVDLGLAEPSESDPLEIVIAGEASRDERELLMALPQDQRTVLLLIAAGLSHEEVAERLGISMRGVRKRVGRANRRLRELGEGAR